MDWLRKDAENPKIAVGDRDGRAPLRCPSYGCLAPGLGTGAGREVVAFALAAVISFSKASARANSPFAR